MDKTKVVDTTTEETFGFLGFDFRRVTNKKSGKPLIILTPKKKAQKAIKEKIREAIQKGGHLPMKELIRKINSSLRGWVNFYRVGNSSKAFGNVREYLEFKIRTLLTRRKRRRKRSVGWHRWSNEYLYGTLGLFWDWKIQHLKPAKFYK